MDTDNGPKPPFGGYRWGVAAEAGYMLRKTSESSVLGNFDSALIDHIFNLEHNSGYIFDKQLDVFVQYKERVKQVLDTKFASLDDVEDLIAKFRDDLTVDGLLDQIHTYLSQIEIIEKRVFGYE